MLKYHRLFRRSVIYLKKKNFIDKGKLLLSNIFSMSDIGDLIMNYISFATNRIWKKSDLRKGGDRSRWLNSPNVYQKVEVLETGTTDPKKITKVEIIKFES